jgi:zinc transport system permease protein
LPAVPIIDDFIIKAVLAAVGIAMVAGALGCFVIWKRMSYFSESIAHSALLGVALGLASGLGIQFGLLIVGGVFAGLITWFNLKNFLSSDTILGIFSHVALSLGIIALGFLNQENVDYFSLLFGDILAITSTDLIWIYAILLLVFVSLIIFWQPLLLLTLSEELAIIQGVNRTFYQLLLMSLIALVVSVASQIVGVLLITSLLIIPPAIARVFAYSARMMLGYSMLVSVSAIALGLWASVQYDLPAGPAIVSTLGGLFLLSQISVLTQSRSI